MVSMNDGTPHEDAPTDTPEVAELIDELEAADPADAPPIAERIAETLGDELDAATDEPDTDDGEER